MNPNFLGFIFFFLFSYSSANAYTLTIAQYNGGSKYDYECQSFVAANPVYTANVCGQPFHYSYWCTKPNAGYYDYQKAWYVTTTPLSLTIDCATATEQEVTDFIDAAEAASEDGRRCPVGFLEKNGGCYTDEYCDIGTSINAVSGSCEPDDCPSGSYQSLSGAGCEVCPSGTQCYVEPDPDPCALDPSLSGCGNDPDSNGGGSGTDGGSGSGASLPDTGSTVSPGSGDFDNDGIPDADDTDQPLVDNGDNPDSGSDYTGPTPPSSGQLPTGSDGDVSNAGIIDWLNSFFASDPNLDVEGQTGDLRAEVVRRSVNIDLGNLPQLNATGFLAESCPAPLSISTSYGTISVSFDSICSLAYLIKPLLIALVTYLVYMRVFYTIVEVAD